MQYTLRGIPEALDEAIRRRAREEGKSLNEVVIKVLSECLEVSGGKTPRRDLTDVVGSWKREAAVEAALRAQRRIDFDTSTWEGRARSERRRPRVNREQRSAARTRLVK